MPQARVKRAYTIFQAQCKTKMWGLGFKEQGQVLVKVLKYKAFFFLSYTCSAHTPFSHWTTLVKHKFKDKISKNAKTVVAEH